MFIANCLPFRVDTLNFPLDLKSESSWQIFSNIPPLPIWGFGNWGTSMRESYNYHPQYLPLTSLSIALPGDNWQDTSPPKFI